MRLDCFGAPGLVLVGNGVAIIIAWDGHYGGRHCDGV